MNTSIPVVTGEAVPVERPPITEIWGYGYWFPGGECYITMTVPSEEFARKHAAKNLHGFVFHVPAEGGAA